jgi:uncharacterized protein with HEPN domain
LPFSDSQSHLRDIIGAIDDIQKFTEGMDAAAFHADAKTRAAVERKFLVIGEAASRLGDQAARLCPGLPWQNIRGIGNRIRHGYDTVNPEIIWNTVQDHLPLAARSGDERAQIPGSSENKAGAMSFRIRPSARPTVTSRACYGRSAEVVAAARGQLLSAPSAGKNEQGPTATLALLASLAMWFV